jgi:hypothetical protein
LIEELHSLLGSRLDEWHVLVPLILIAEMIHRKAPSAVLDFARAFELRKDR